MSKCQVSGCWDDATHRVTDPEDPEYNQLTCEECGWYHTSLGFTVEPLDDYGSLD